MHDKKKYINETPYSIQGLRPVSKALPRGLKTILKKFESDGYCIVPIENCPEPYQG